MLSAARTSGVDHHPPGADDGDGEAFVEKDPSGRYGRYEEKLGKGAVKDVYRAFDQEKGIEVAWNQVFLRHFQSDANRIVIDSLYQEVRLLSGVQDPHVIAFHSAWIDKKDPANKIFNFITEACTSGNLRQYRNRHRNVSIRAIKRWARQILCGLQSLHARGIIHRDVNPSNVFINGNSGEVKIGDLGFATLLRRPGDRAHEAVGTPEFTAPEVYDEDYDELVDIFSFGMCVLELVTLDMPYLECKSRAEVLHKVYIKKRPPLALDKVKDPDVKAFIQKCIAPANVRPSAADLLRDPFFHGIDEVDVVVQSL